MSTLTINDLPRELIIEILRRIDRNEGNALNNAVLTCKLWKELIECSCSWFLRIPPTGLSAPKVNFLLKTNRKFHRIHLDDVAELGKNNLIEIFKRLGRNVVDLHITRRSSLDKYHLFVEMLNCMPNLKRFEVHDTTKWDMSDKPAVGHLPDLRKLETLYFFGNDLYIIKCFARSQPKTIEISTLSTIRDNLDFGPVIELIRSRKELTSLGLGSVYFTPPEPLSGLFRTDILGRVMPFQLTTLSLKNFELQNVNDYKNMLKFMQQHQKTIRELTLGSKFPNFIYEFVFAKFTNLKSIQINTNKLPSDMKLMENKNISNLTLMDSFDSNSLKNILLHLPNVTELTLKGSGGSGGKEIMSFVASNLTKLTKLSVSFFTESMFNGVQFPKLTSLNINWLKNKIDWDMLTNENSKITELTIKSVLDNSLDSMAFETITTNLKLQRIKIGYGFCADNNFYDIIRRNCLDLKILEMHSSMSIEDDFSGLGDVPGLRFYDN